MCRMILGTGLLLCGLFQQEVILRAQEPAFISGDLAVRFEQAPGFFNYAAWCRTATEFSATAPPARLPWKSTEPGACWYVMGTKMRNDGGKVDGSPMVDGKLVISAHHVRFIPHDSKLAALYVDFHPEETELLHHPGQEFAALGTTKILIAFKFSKICPACALGTPIPEGKNTELLEQEFQLVLDQIKHFDAAYRHFFALASKIRVEVRAQNQPGGNDVPEAMRLYSDLNRRFAEACPEPAKACIRSYAVYQACIADHGGAKCGSEPNCSAACPLSVDQLQSLKARACVQYDQPGASLIPDWTDVLRRKNAGNVPIQPLPTGVLDVQLVSGSNQPAGLGCSVQASYQRASNPGTEMAGTVGSAGAAHAVKPVAVPVARSTTTAAATPNIVSPPRPGSPQTVSHPTAAATPSVVAVAKPSTAAPTVHSPDPRVIPTQKLATTTLKIAPGTAEGMLVKKVPPTYPLEAKVARVQGTVLLNVSVSKTGAVTSVDVVSGPEMLQSAAVDAVKQWQFRPFSLLGEPVEFETAVHVVFGTGTPPPRVQAQGHP